MKVRVFLLCAALAPVFGYTPSRATKQLPTTTRRNVLPFLATSFVGLTAPRKANAGDKLTGLAPAEIAKIVKRDLEEKQFLASGQLSREIYDEACLFTDEIDTYTLDKWIKGTSKLFVASESHVDLVGDVEATAEAVKFRFSETLAFNIPFRPKVKLTGLLQLNRGSDGLITSYREFWDQSVTEVLKTARI